MRDDLHALLALLYVNVNGFNGVRMIITSCTCRFALFFSSLLCVRTITLHFEMVHLGLALIAVFDRYS